MLNKLIVYLKNNYPEQDYLSFYRDLFPVNSFEKKGEYEQGKYNGIIIELCNKETQKEKQIKVKRHTVTDDLEKIIELAQGDNFCLMSPISYAGKSRNSNNARDLYAIAIDLDGLRQTAKNSVYGIMGLFHQIHNIDRIPNPTYVISSGTGLHLYYILKEPISLYRNVAKKLQRFKQELTRIIWQDEITSLSNNVQYESLFQGFRVVGTTTKKGDRAIAFKTGEKVDIAYLNQFVRDNFKITNLKYESKLNLEEAKAKYPEWYEKRIVRGEKRGTWTCKRDLYEWWKRRVLEEAKTGHRYYCMMCLAIYARKSGIDFETLEKDAFEIGKVLKRIPATEENPFTDSDILDALQAYDDHYMTFPINSIAYVSGIPITKNKRNFRKRDLHLKVMNSTREVLYAYKNWRDGNGRPSKQEEVERWRKKHLGGTPKECMSDTGLSKNTVYKWWK